MNCFKTFQTTLMNPVGCTMNKAFKFFLYLNTRRMRTNHSHEPFIQYRIAWIELFKITDLMENCMRGGARQLDNYTFLFFAGFFHFWSKHFLVFSLFERKVCERKEKKKNPRAPSYANLLHRWQKFNIFVNLTFCPERDKLEQAR